MSFTPWTFDDALNLVRHLQVELEASGFHVAMAGSVLLKGESSNDLDVIVYPHTTAKIDMTTYRSILEGMGLRLLADRIRVAQIWKRSGSLDTKHVEAWETPSGQKVDLFFLR